MDGTLLVLRSDLVVYVPPAAIHIDQAIAMRESFEEATGRTVRVVVIPAPVTVMDMRNADPELEELAERIAARIPEAVGA